MKNTIIYFLFGTFALLLPLCFSLTNPVFLEESYNTGFIPIRDEADIFYVLFESRSNSETDPLVIWLQGDFGLSSLLSVFKENGPFLFDSESNLKKNEFSWNNHANLLYVDQPIGIMFIRKNMIFIIIFDQFY